MNTATIGPKLRHLVRDLGRAIVWRYAGKTSWGDKEYLAAFQQELAKYDLNHPDFVADIARAFVKGDLAERAKHDPFKTDPKTGALDVARFKPKDFAKGIIRLGNGLNVRMADASARQWIARQLHQQRAAEKSQRASTKTTLFLQTEPGVLLIENPSMKTVEAMRQACLPLWENIEDDLHEDDEDESSEDENDDEA